MHNNIQKCIYLLVPWYENLLFARRRNEDENTIPNINKTDKPVIARAADDPDFRAKHSAQTLTGVAAAAAAGQQTPARAPCRAQSTVASLEGGARRRERGWEGVVGLGQDRGRGARASTLRSFGLSCLLLAFVCNMLQ